jgi:predicted transcriptional regulator
MAQMTIYLPDDLEKRARKAAKAKGKSVSRWIADQVAERLQSTWPKAVLDAAGIAPDFPSAEELRKGYAKDIPRKSLA